MFIISLQKNSRLNWKSACKNTYLFANFPSNGKKITWKGLAHLQWLILAYNNPPVRLDDRALSAVGNKIPLFTESRGECRESRIRFSRAFYLGRSRPPPPCLGFLQFFFPSSFPFGPRRHRRGRTTHAASHIKRTSVPFEDEKLTVAQFNLDGNIAHARSLRKHPEIPSL